MKIIDGTPEVLPHPETRIRRRPAAVAIVGMGYVGLLTALGLHDAGVPTIGIDISAERLRGIQSERADLVEADRERLHRALRDERFVLTADPARMAEAGTVIVCVPTPIDRNLTPDLTALEDGCRLVVRHARHGQTLILTSTSFVGTTRQLLVEPLAARGLIAGKDLHVAFSPERIGPGNSQHARAAMPRVIGGITEACAARAEQVLSAVTDSLHLVSSAEAAELTKLYETSFRAVNIALANEFAEICGTLRLDPIEITRAAATKPYGFMAFFPGPGVGGDCIPSDPHYLLWQLRASRDGAPLISQAMNQIAYRPQRVVDRAVTVLSDSGRGAAGARVLVVGVSYKPGVCDVRESSALEIIEGLQARGAKVEFYDPLVDRVAVHGGRGMDSVAEPHGADWDLVLIHTVHPGHDYSWIQRCPVVLDATYSFAGATHKSVV